MWIEITVPVGVLGLVDGQPLPEGTKLEFERTASVLDGGLPSFVVAGDHAATVVRTIQAHPTVEDTTIVGDTDDETVFRLNWDETVPDLLECIRENDGTVLSAIAQDDVWTFDIRFPSTDAASRFCTGYGDDTFPITIRRMNQQGAPHHLSNGQISAKQREALSCAVTGGYFEVPRRTKLVDLAGELGISDTAVSQRLRRGLSTILSDSAFASEMTAEAARSDDWRR